MTTQFKFATYSALLEAGKQASAEMRELEQYLAKTSEHPVKKQSTSQQAENRARSSSKRNEKVAV